MVIRVITQHIKPLAISQITVGHCKAWPFEGNSFQIQLGLLFLHTDRGPCNEIVGVCLQSKHDVFVCRMLQEVWRLYMCTWRQMAGGGEGDVFQKITLPLTKGSQEVSTWRMNERQSFGPETLAQYTTQQDKWGSFPSCGLSCSAASTTVAFCASALRTVGNASSGLSPG